MQDLLPLSAVQSRRRIRVVRRRAKARTRAKARARAKARTRAKARPRLARVALGIRQLCVHLESIAQLDRDTYRFYSHTIII